jgi:hypothetical protein
MRITHLAFAAALLASSPLAAQEPTDAGVKVGFSTGYMFFGPIVPEVTNHVRLGNMGQDQFFEIGIDKPLGGKLGLVANMIVAPTQLYQWPKEGEIGRTWRAEGNPNIKVYNTTWSCLTLGLRHRPVGWVEGTAGAGACSVSGASYKQFGAIPMTAGTLQLGLSASKEIAPGIALQANCTAYPSYSARATGQPYTVYRVMSGYSDTNTGFWTNPIKCGGGLRAGL